MRPDDLTEKSLLGILRDAATRCALVEAMKSEHGTDLPLSNKYAEVASTFEASSGELDDLVEVLLKEQQEGLLGELAFHRGLSDKTLIRLLDGGLVLELGHRSGPEWLLLRLANEHEYPEAILKLIHSHYGVEGADSERFNAFVRRFVHVAWVRDSIRHARKMPANLKESALAIVAEYEEQQPEPVPRRKR